MHNATSLVEEGCSDELNTEPPRGKLNFAPVAPVSMLRTKTKESWWHPTLRWGERGAKLSFARG